MVAVVPIAATLALSTAWGAIGLGRHFAWRPIERLFRHELEPVSEPVGVHPEQAASAAVNSLPPVVLPWAGVPVEGLPAAPLPSRAKVIGRHAPKPASLVSPTPAETPVAEPSPAPLSADKDNLLYAVAHRAHFVDKDPTAALSAWNAYLAARPDGRFAAEARYNRALCLVRLGRMGEAWAALDAFEKGLFGPYRQQEAKRLLRALSDR